MRILSSCAGNTPGTDPIRRKSVNVEIAVDLSPHLSEHHQLVDIRWLALTRPTVPFTSQRSGGNTLNRVTRSVCHFHRTSRTGSFKGRQQRENARDDDLSLESKRCSAMRRTISSTRRASCMSGWVCRLQRYALLDVVVGQATLSGDRALELIVMLTLVSRTIAPSLRRFPTLSRSSLAFQRTMSGFKQVCTQQE